MSRQAMDALETAIQAHLRVSEDMKERPSFFGFHPTALAYAADLHSYMVTVTG